MQSPKLTRKALFIIVSIVSSSQGFAQPLAGRNSLSPEGRAIMASFFLNPDPMLRRCQNDQKEVRSRIVEEGKRSALNWPAAKQLLIKQADLKVRCSTLAEAQTIKMMERLPAADRATFYRQLYQSSSTPQITIPSGRSSEK